MRARGIMTLESAFDLWYRWSRPEYTAPLLWWMENASFPGFVYMYLGCELSCDLLRVDGWRIE